MSYNSIILGKDEESKTNWFFYYQCDKTLIKEW